MPPRAGVGRPTPRVDMKWMEALFYRKSYWMFSVTVLDARPFEVTTTGTAKPESPAGTEQLI